MISALGLRIMAAKRARAWNSAWRAGGDIWRAATAEINRLARTAPQNWR